MHHEVFTHGVNVFPNLIRERGLLLHGNRRMGECLSDTTNRKMISTTVCSGKQQISTTIDTIMITEQFLPMIHPFTKQATPIGQSSRPTKRPLAERAIYSANL